MKIVDKYIIQKYLSTFVFTVAIFCVVIVIFDISEKIDDFNKHNASMSQVFMEYYALGSLPFFINMLTPLFNFIAVIFFTSKMADQTEIVPILSGGMSFYRMLRPYMFCAGLIFAMTLISNVYIIPYTNKIKVNFENVYVKPHRVSTTSSSIHMQVDSNTYVYMGSFDTKTKVGYNFTLEKFQEDVMTEKLMAERITWDSVANKWSLHVYSNRLIDGLDEDMVKGEKRDTTLDMRPQDFESYENVFTTMDQDELNDRISKEAVRGTGMMNELLLEKYKRIINPFSAFVLTLIGVSLSSKKVRGGIGLSLGLGIALSCIYIVLERFSSMFSIKGGLDPLISVLIPNVIFLVLSIYLLRKAPK